MENISVVIPAYNEENAIQPVIERLRKVKSGLEIIVVDDGSTDDTAAKATTAHAKVVRRQGNVGYGRSIKDGVQTASHDTIVIMDADGTYPVESIPDLVTEYEKGYDLVVGARTGSAYRGSFLKYPARIVFKWLVEFATGKHIPDINSGLRVFSKKTTLIYLDDLCDTFSFTTTQTLVYHLTHHTVAYLPIHYDKRIGKSKVRIFRDALRTLQYITECIARFNPLKLFIILSLLSVIVGAAMTWVAGWLAFTIGLVGALLIFSVGIGVVGLRR